MKNLNEFSRYIIAGVVNTATGYGIFWALLKSTSLGPEIANSIGYAIALGVAFILNRVFVFEGARIFAAAATRFVIAFAIAFLLNQAVLFILFRLLSVRPEIAQIFAMATYTVTFYLLNKHFVFGLRERR
jgi:putative flippase GtrA